MSASFKEIAKTGAMIAAYCGGLVVGISAASKAIGMIEDASNKRKAKKYGEQVAAAQAELAKTGGKRTVSAKIAGVAINTTVSKPRATSAARTTTRSKRGAAVAA